MIFNLSYFAGVSYSFLLTSIFPKPEMAMALVPVLIIPFLLLAGFFVNQNNIPYYFYPFEYLSIFKYCFQAAIIVNIKIPDLNVINVNFFLQKNEFDGKIWYCSPTDLCDPVGEMNFVEGLWTCVWVLAIIGVSTRALACWVLIKNSTPQRPKLIKKLKIDEEKINIINGK